MQLDLLSLHLLDGLLPLCFTIGLDSQQQRQLAAVALYVSLNTQLFFLTREHLIAILHFSPIDHYPVSKAKYGHLDEIFMY